MLSLKKSSPLLFGFLVAAVLSLPARGQTLPVEPPSLVAVVGGTLIDGTGRSPVPDTTLLIEDGRIRQIGRRGEVPIPVGAQVIQADGKYLIPGLIDVHVHYNAPFLHRLYLAHGVTTVRDVGTSLERILTLREEIARGNILAPRLFATGGSINTRSLRAAGVSAREMTERLAKAGVDGIKVTGYNEEELKDILEVAHAHGLLVFGHTRLDPGALRAIEIGIDGIEHVTDVLEDCVEENPPFPPDFDWSNRDHFFRHYYSQLHSAVNRDKLDEIIQLMVQNDVYLDPTLVNYNRGFVQRNTAKLAADPAFRYMPEEYDRSNRYGEYGSGDREQWTKTFALMQEATYKFFKAGGFLLMGTDSQAAAPDGALPGSSMHEELEFFVGAGLTPMEVLQTATFNNAKVMNQDKDLGTLETGKYADLIILDANPLENISNTQKIHLVIKDGLVLDPQALLREHIRQYGERGMP
ncbi:MAG: amidohydrolase family protein [Acidobacteria bacterium]|nr:amidohydrolase family protein [Acidobacteriota bacterium]MCZ6767750.1 amidohydrolase family protein [Acidobacteriota bacterium]MCZ6877087.1 amidohydrolase family protein [Acidobacteriota bacterium]